MPGGGLGCESAPVTVNPSEPKASRTWSTYFGNRVYN